MEKKTDAQVQEVKAPVKRRCCCRKTKKEDNK